MSLARFRRGVAVGFARVAGHEAGGVVEDAVLAAHQVPRVLHLALQVVVERCEPSKGTHLKVLHLHTSLRLPESGILNKTTKIFIILELFVWVLNHVARSRMPKYTK